MTTFTREQQMVLHLTEQGISQTPSALVWSEEDLRALNWKAVLQECVYQTVTLLCFDKIAKYKQYIPVEVYNDWKMRSFVYMQKNAEILQTQADLIEVLKENQFPYVIIKGTATAAYYPKPELRILGDIDFYIEPRMRKPIVQALEKKGFVDQKDTHVYHVNLKKDNVTVEMHFDLPGMPSGELGERARCFFENIFITSELHNNDFFEDKEPNVIHHGVIILLHALSHQTGYGMGLRHLCDWAVFVQATQKQAYWQESLLPFFKEIGVYRYACALTKTAALYLGISCPDWAKDVEEELCAQLLGDMFTAGNFGNKNLSYSKSAQLIENKDGKNRGPIKTLVYSLHQAILWRHPIVKKVWILYPFVFVWKVVKNLFLMCIGKRVSLTQTLPEAKKRRKIYEQLRVFEPQGEEK